MVSQSTGCSQPELLERLYTHYAQPSAWHVSHGAAQALQKIRSSGVPYQLTYSSGQHLRPCIIDAVLGICPTGRPYVYSCDSFTSIGHVHALTAGIGIWNVLQNRTQALYRVIDGTGDLGCSHMPSPLRGGQAWAHCAVQGLTGPPAWVMQA